jgi:hypothetical protein
MARSKSLSEDTASDEVIEAGDNTKEEKVIRTAADRNLRKKRKPFGIPRSKLGVDIPEEDLNKYHYHWINDVGGRLSEAQNGDYEFVSSKELGLGDRESKIKVLVGTNEDGSPMYAYLMRINKEWYDEDQQELQKLNDRIDEQIRKGKLNETPGDNRYIPQGGISIKT